MYEFAPDEEDGALDNFDQRIFVRSELAFSKIAGYVAVDSDGNLLAGARYESQDVSSEPSHIERLMILDRYRQNISENHSELPITPADIWIYEISYADLINIIGTARS